MFPYRLALALGGATVGELLGRMSGEEYVTWMAVDEIMPLGDLAGEDRRRAWGLALKLTDRRRKGDPPVQVEDCMLRPGQARGRERRQTPEQMKAAMMLIMATGGEDEKRQRKAAPPKRRKRTDAGNR